MPRRRSARILAMLALALAPGAALAQHGPGLRLLPKQLAAPPGDVLSGRLRLPDPATLADVSRLTIVPVTLSRGADGAISWTGSVAIDDAASVRMALIGPAGEPLSWTVTMPAAPGDQRREAPAPIRVERAPLELEDGARDAEARVYAGGTRGRWGVTVTGPAPAAAQLIIVTDSPIALRTHLTTLRHVVGQPIGIVASIEANGAAPAGAAITGATVQLTEPNAEPRVIPMFDDGAHDDGAAGDGVFGAAFTPASVGAFDARIVAEAMTPDGLPIERTSAQRVSVVPAGVALTPRRGAFAWGHADTVAPATTLRIDIPAAFDDPTRRCFVAGEVWGHDPESGAAKPAAWAGIMTEPRADAGADSLLSLHLDARWLATSVVAGPFELRNVRVQDADTFTLLDERAAIPLAIDAGVTLPGATPREVAGDMLVGRPRTDLALAPTIPGERIEAANATTRAFGAHNLMLVHGWCAGGNPWPPADFTGYTEAFSDPDANRSNDQFAQLLLAFGNNSKSYGIIAHSQGGCAALHLWTFYFSGLDWATGSRLIQSLGSPYQGTPLASYGFFTCGVNNDLTPSGAAAWLANIPTAQRDAVYYYTTSPSSGNCNFVTNLILGSPNDGVTEVARDQLPGAHAMGNTLGWCHTTGMNQPAQYTDHTRNAEMNTNAAR